jgi:beta-galactosidase GanA
MRKSALLLFLLLSPLCFSEGNFKTPTPFSVQMHTLTGDFESHRKSVDMIRELGIKQVRDECFWHIVEKNRGEYRIPEHVLKNLDYSLKAGLDTLIILNYANDLYDEGMAPASPEAIKAFGQYCLAMARELKGKVHYFEVWNEPNADGFWKPRADPVAYTRLLKEAYKRIKEGNPNALVCGLTLSGLDEDFLWKVMEEGGYDYLDVVSLHPYCHPKTPEDAEIFEKMDAIHDRFAEYGRKKKDIWITEVGWPTNKGGGISEFEQAVRISRTYLNAMTYQYIQTVFIYWFGPDGPDEEWAEDRFGIIHGDYSPKPSFFTYKTLTTYLAGASLVNVVYKDINNTRLIHFKDKKSGDNLYALWGVNGYAEAIAHCEKPLKAVNMTGESYDLSPYRGKLYFRVEQLPILVISRDDIEWETQSKPSIQFQFAENILVIPRGLERFFTISTPEDMKNPVVQFERKKEAGLSFEKTQNGYTSRVAGDAKNGIVRFSALVSDEKAGMPSIYAQGHIEVCDPVEVYISPLPPQREFQNFLVEVKNLSPSPVSGKIILTPPSSTISLDKLEFNLPRLTSNETHTERVGFLSRLPSDEIVPIKGRVDLETGIKVEFEQIISFYPCVKMEKPPVIDGDLSDWPPGAQGINLGSKEQHIAGYVPWGGPEDSSARIFTAWDDDWLYIAGEFQDDVLSSPCAGFTVYNNDGIEIYLDTDHEGDRDEAHYSDDDHQYGFCLEKGKPVVYSWSQLKGYSRESRIAMNLDPQICHTLTRRDSGTGLSAKKRMILEGAIPMKELNIKLRDGLHIGINLALTDDDDPLTIHPFFQEIQFSWSKRRNSWQNPRVFGDLFFIDPAKKGALSKKKCQFHLDGKPFLPFGFWTFGRNEEMFRELASHHINALAVEFSWKELEPYPDRFSEDYLKDCLAFLDLARKYDLYCVVQFGMHYSPDWLTGKYPDLYFRKSDGSRGEGSFMPFCPDKPAYREEVLKGVERFADAFKDHPQVLAYSLWNEPGLKGDICYCQDTLKRFQGTPPKEPTPGQEWLSWMQFRQDNFLAFFQEIKDRVRKIDQVHPITIKGVWRPMDSRVAWGHGTRYDYWAKISDIMGHDPYPHPNDFFITRWIADWLRSSASDKPAWYLEFNRAFARERGLPTPAEIRSWTYQALAHGIRGFFYFFHPMGNFDPDAGDNSLAFIYSDTLQPVPAMEEIYRIGEELNRIYPLLKDFDIPEPEIAILHSWTTQFQMPGDLYPTANETVPAEILYRLGYRINYLTEDDMVKGRLKGCKILFVTGTVALAEDVLKRIEEYHKEGGHIFACARFAEKDENALPREIAPPPYFGVTVLKRNSFPRERINLPPFENKIYFNDHSVKHESLERFRYGTAHPMKWESRLFDFIYQEGLTYKGDPFEAGHYVGFEDMKTETEVIEHLQADKTAQILAGFGSLIPGIVVTPRTVYIGRDLSWCNETMASFIHAAVNRAGVKRFAWAEDDSFAAPRHIDVGVLKNGEGRHLAIFTCSDRLYEWDGNPSPIRIFIQSSKPLRNLMTGEVISEQKKPGIFYTMERKFSPGEVLIISE